jgi:hypothetical protein
MNLTGNIRKPVRISEALALSRGKSGKVNPLASRLTRQQLTELFPICLGEVSIGITGCLLIIRKRYLVGHFSVTVQNFPVTVAFRGGTILESIKKIFKSLSGLTVSHQHF